MVPFVRKTAALEIVQSKIYSLDTISKHNYFWKFKTQKIIFTNGCFDIVHRGHIDYLAKASDLGDILVVGLNSDASVKRQGKSISRPLQDEQSRALIIASLHFVNAVIIFDEDTPLNLITAIKPDILVKGADYDAEEKNKENKKYIVGSDVVRNSGGKVMTIDYLQGYSTTIIEQKIKGA